MAEQPSVTLNDGAVMPQFGLGVWQTPDDEAPEVVRAAVSAGYRMVDTAAIYGNEAGVGRGLGGAEGVYLTTKLWNDRQGFDATLQAFGDSEKRLGRRIDLYLIHWPRPSGLQDSVTMPCFACAWTSCFCWKRGCSSI